MNLIKKIFVLLFAGTLNKNTLPNQETSTITAKDKQSIFIKTYLKPNLKAHGYSTNAQTWWRDNGDFFIIINLQNFSWNTRNNVDFCFNIGIALKSKIKDFSKKPTHFDLTVRIREGAYLSESRKTTRYRSKAGYSIDQSTNLDDFIMEAKFDFEDEILPTLGKLKTITDCLDFYGNMPFWGSQLKKLL